jgi:hypothetical protein
MIGTRSESACGSTESDLPFPVSLRESRGGRVPPTPRTLPASKLRWHASMLRLPPQEEFQSAPLKSPLRDPPVRHRQFHDDENLPDPPPVRYKCFLS